MQRKRFSDLRQYTTIEFLEPEGREFQNKISFNCFDYNLNGIEAFPEGVLKVKDYNEIKKQNTDIKRYMYYMLNIEERLLYIESYIVIDRILKFETSFIYTIPQGKTTKNNYEEIMLDVMHIGEGALYRGSPYLALAVFLGYVGEFCKALEKDDIYMEVGSGKERVNIFVLDDNIKYKVIPNENLSNLFKENIDILKDS